MTVSQWASDKKVCLVTTPERPDTCTCPGIQPLSLFTFFKNYTHTCLLYQHLGPIGHDLFYEHVVFSHYSMKVATVYIVISPTVYCAFIIKCFL